MQNCKIDLISFNNVIFSPDFLSLLNTLGVDIYLLPRTQNLCYSYVQNKATYLGVAITEV